MPLRFAAFAAGLAACQACTPREWLFPADVKSWSPNTVPAQFPSKIVVRVNSSAPAGMKLWAANGSQVASIDCELTHESSKYAVGDLPEVTCPIPPLAVGTYSARFSSDRSCGAWSYRSLGSSIFVIEPAHLTAVTPAHGPEDVVTSIRLSGSNMGGQHVFCNFIFPPAPGAKIGCEMGQADDVASDVTPTSAVCRIPKWPGPVPQYDGHGGFKPTPGAACSREVHVQLTNDALVYSQEPIVFRYDSSTEVLV